MVERQGRVRAMVVPDRSAPSLQGNARRYVLPASMIFTDEFPLYRGLTNHFAGHHRIKHKAGVYVDGDVHTQTIEGFWGLVKIERHPPRRQSQVPSVLLGRVRRALQLARRDAADVLARFWTG